MNRRNQMKIILKVLIIVTMPLFVLTADLPFLMVDLVPDANAILGVRRRAVRRGVVIGAAAAESTAATNTNAAAATTAQQQSATAQQQSATAQQQSATAQQQSATAQQQSATAQKTTPPPPPSGTALPMGTVVHTLPANCPAKAINGVEYYYCGGNYYRTAFQGSNLIYVTATPQ
jgi:hypothetical protein